MDREKIIDLFTTLLKDHKALLHNTHEIKRVLLEGYYENSLEENIKERRLLIDKIDSLVKYYHSIKECPDFTDNCKWKLQKSELLQQIQQLSNATAFLNDEIISLINQRIKNVTFDLEKIQEGKHLVSNLKKHVNNTPSLVDVCG